MTDAVSAAGGAAEEGHSARLDASVNRCYTSYLVTAEEAVMRRAVAAVKQIGLEPMLKVGQGAQDANVFNLHGIRTVALGAGAYQPHSCDEYLKVEELVLGVELFLALAAGDAQ